MKKPTTLALLTSLLSTVALAHDADIVYARLERVEGAAEVSQVVTMTATTLSMLAPVDVDGNRELTQGELDERAEAISLGVWDQMPLSAGGAGCARGAAAARLRETYVELSARWECGPGELSQVFRLLSVLPAAYKVVIGSVVDGGRGQRFAQGNQQTIFYDERTEPAARVSGLLEWIGLGVVHIFSGIDHLCFLLALLLVGGTWRRVLLMVTAFTLAHSITLGAAALELVVLPEPAQRWVEAAIALSIVWVAVENLVLREHRHRAAITFAFGLVHGFGFASVLRSYGLGDSVVAGLLGFNLGVELGQAALVLVLFPLLRLAQRRPVAGPWVVRAGSAAVLVAGGYWLVERVLG